MMQQRPAKKYREDVLAAVTALLADRPQAKSRPMFGPPGFAVGTRMFATLYDEGLAVKLPLAEVPAALARPDVEVFRPYGRTMREWVLIVHADLDQYEGDLDLLDAAIAYAGARP